MVEEEECYVNLYFGSNYTLGPVENVGDLKSELEEILKRLPQDNSLVITEVSLHGGKIRYSLKDGIPHLDD